MSLGIKTIDSIRKLTFGAIDRAKMYDKLTINTICDRTGDDEIRDHINNKWHSIGKTEEFYYTTCGNLRDQFYLSDDDSKGIIVEKGRSNWENRNNLFTDSISSPMLLYRCCCTFPESIEIQNNGKSIWSCRLKHKNTENGLLLSEHKGTPTIGLDLKFRTTDDIPEEFSNDIVELMNYLLSDQCTHPYDNVVAGAQA